MSGQGSPTRGSTWKRYPAKQNNDSSGGLCPAPVPAGVLSRPKLGWLVLVLSLGFAFANLNAGFAQVISSQTSGADHEIAIRMSWGGSTPQTWAGVVKAELGKLIDASPLGFEDDASGGIHLQSGTLHLLDKRPAQYSGVDVRYRGPLDGKLIFDLRCDGQPEFKQEFSVSELLAGKLTKELGSRHGQLSISRRPGDRLKVQFEYPDLVFDLGKSKQTELKFVVQPELTGISTRNANLKYRLRGPTGVITTRSQAIEMDAKGSAPAQKLELELPQREGVYEVQLDLEPNWYQAGFGNRQPSVSRSIQFVVLDGRPRHEVAEVQVPWKTQRVYQAGRLSQPSRGNFYLRRIASTPRQIFGNDKRRQIQGDSLQLQLEPGGWQAIPITFDRPGQPHRVEIDFEASPGISLGVSILEVDPQGQVPLMGCDSGVQVSPDFLSTAGSTTGTHQVTLWPRQREAYLLLANRDPQSVATCSEIRIKTGPNFLPAQKVVEGNRKILAYIQSPMLAEMFGVEKRDDPVIGHRLDDWTTFYESCDRLIQQLKYQGYGGAFLNVVDEGSALFPTPALNPSPKYDSGVFFSSGQDPVRKDVLKLLLAMFEREGLVLIPSLNFETPIGSLEHRRRSTHLDLVHFRGGTRSSEQSQLPIYNALNPEVQKSIGEVVRWIGERYQDYDSMQGICLNCSPRSYLHMAGREWGFDPLTIRRFESVATNRQAQSEAQFRESLLTSRFNEWKAWRQNNIKQWHDQMGRRLGQQKPGCRLLFYFDDLYRNEEVASLLSPSLHLRSDYTEAIGRLGLQAQKEYADSNIQLVGIQARSSAGTLGKRRVGIQAKQLIRDEAFFESQGNAVDAVVHKATWAHFSELQSLAFPQQASPLMRLQAMTPTGPAGPRRFVDFLQHHDSIWLVDSQNALLHVRGSSRDSFFQAFQSLPAKPMDSVDCQGTPERCPITVRQRTDDTGWKAYLVNNSPWPASVQINLTGDVNSVSRVVTGREKEPVSVVDKMARMELKPFELVVLQGRADVRAEGFRFDFPALVKQQLQLELRRLQSQLMKANRVAPLGTLENSSFETSEPQGVASWSVGEQDAELVKVDSTQAKDGSQSLRMQYGKRPVWIRSSEFSTPATGRLSVSAWIRCAEGQQPTVRIAVEGRTAQRSYYRFGAVGGIESRKIGSQWQKFAVHFDDLPVHGMDSLRVGFDLMGPGTLWVDQVEIFDRWLDSTDSTALTQRLAGAATMLENVQNWNSARLVMDGYWAKFLRESFAEKPEATSASRSENGAGTHRDRRSRARSRAALPFR